MPAHYLIRCPDCGRDLPENAFGICRARKSGRNLYDKECIRNKVYTQRQRVREMKAARKQYKKLTIETIERKPFVVSPYVPMSALAKVRNAVKAGYTTRDEIHAWTKLEWDQLGEALAELTFERGVLRIERVGKQRKFRLADQITEYAA